MASLSEHERLCSLKRKLAVRSDVEDFECVSGSEGLYRHFEKHENTLSKLSAQHAISLLLATVCQ